MFGSILLTVPLLNLSVARTDFVDARYLLPTYLALAPLFGLALFSIRPRPLAGLLVAAALALNLGSQWTAPPLAGREGGRFDTDGRRLVAQLEARGVDSVYASYWTAYRIAFLSRGRIAASPFGTATHSFVRDLALQARVDASPHPRYLLTGGDQRRFSELLVRRGLPHRRERFEGYTLFSDLDAETAERLRICHCIPAAVSPGAIEWLEAEGPERIRENGGATYTVRFRTRLLMPMSNNVHLSYRWRPADGSASVEGGRVSIASKAMRGATVQLDLPVVANLPPGRHRLVIDLVEENFAWFEDLGLPPKALDVTVEPAGGRSARALESKLGRDSTAVRTAADFPATFYNSSGNTGNGTAHGDSVIGILAAPDNGYGVTGIAHRASIGLQSVLGVGVANAILQLRSTPDPAGSF